MGQLYISDLWKKEDTPFSELWSLCKIEETRLKEKSDVGSNEQVQAFVAMARRKGRLERFGPQKRTRMICGRSNAMDVMNMGITREIVLNSRRTTTKEEGKNPMSLKKWKKLKRIN